jgi:hypothetical protein
MGQSSRTLCRSRIEAGLEPKLASEETLGRVVSEGMVSAGEGGGTAMLWMVWSMGGSSLMADGAQ